MIIPLFETSTNFDATFRDVWISLLPEQRLYVLSGLNQADLDHIGQRWGIFAHGYQRPPDCAQGGGSWTTWLLIGGRGAGKTKSGAEWVRSLAGGERPVSPIALIGETEHDVREVMIEGPSGILAVHGPSGRPQWTSSRRRLQWPNGALAYAFSAEDP